MEDIYHEEVVRQEVGISEHHALRCWRVGDVSVDGWMDGMAFECWYENG